MATSPSSRPEAAPSTLRAGVVGVGARARIARLLEATDPDARLTAVCDPHPDLRSRVTRVLERDPSTLALTTTVDDLVNSGVDVAFVTSTDDTHADITCTLLEAGIAVYVEKPLAVKLDDATRILEAARRTGSRLYVGHNMRHMGLVRKMRELIDGGLIGEVKAIWCRHFIGMGGDAFFKDWHASREHVDSLLIHKATHDFDALQFLTGAHPARVVASGSLSLYGQVSDRRDRGGQLRWDWSSPENWPPLSHTGLNPVVDVEDLSMVLLELDSGIQASYQECHYTPDNWRNYTVVGTEGRIENFGDGPDGVVRLWNKRSDYNPAGDAEFTLSGTGEEPSADFLCVSEFLRFVRGGTPTATSPVDAWYSVAAAVQATDSLRSGSSPREVPRLAEELGSYFGEAQTPRPQAPQRDS